LVRCRAEKAESVARHTSDGTFPLREELDALVRYYHHLQRTHQEEPPGGSTRRHVEEKLRDVRERIERLLAEWVRDEELREKWHAYLEHHAPAPSEPGEIKPLLFRGVSDAGSIAVVRRAPDDTLAVEIDGKLEERVVADKDLAVTIPPLQLRLDDFRFTETFDASTDALDALDSFLEEGGSPPWDSASELVADGLIDLNFSATARGLRALAQNRPH
jgi:hypothetical protein